MSPRTEGNKAKFQAIIDLFMYFFKTDNLDTNSLLVLNSMGYIFKSDSALPLSPSSSNLG